MGRLKEAFHALRVKSETNPAIEALMKDSTSDAALDSLCEETRQARETPSERARIALDELFLQAQGKEWRSRYDALLSKSKIKLIKGGDLAAIIAYAQCGCER